MHHDDRPHTTSAPKILPAWVSQEHIPGVYGRIAPLYDLWAQLTETRAREACIAEAQVRDGERVLEVAVGTGLAFRELVKRNPLGVTEGIDLTEPMLRRARARVARLPGRHQLRVGDATKLEFADESFDLLVNNYMFDLLPEALFATVLGEFRRVLAPGGRLVLVNMALAEARLSRVYELVYRANPSLLGGCRGVALAPWLAQAGFTQVRRRYVSELGFPSEVLSARR